MTGPTPHLQRRYRLLLRSYPKSWRRHHEEEVLAVLLDQAEASDRSTVSAATMLDLVGHGAEERLESLLRWIPARLRTQVATCALVAGAALGLLMLAGEMIGAHYRLPLEEQGYPAYFRSGPFLTMGVGLYLTFLTAALLVVRGHGGVARMLLLAAVAYAAWMRLPFWSGEHAAPRLLVLVLFAGFGLLAALVTIRPARRAARGMTAYGVALVGVVVLGMLATKPVLGWSIGTMATSGNVAFAVLATVLPFVGGAAILVAVLSSRRWPGWSAAIALAALPVAVFCTITSQVVNPTQAADRAWYPLYYLLVLTTVALINRRDRHRSRSTTR